MLARDGKRHELAALAPPYATRLLASGTGCAAIGGGAARSEGYRKVSGAGEEPVRSTVRDGKSPSRSIIRDGKGPLQKAGATGELAGTWKRPQGCADLPAAGRLRPALQGRAAATPRCSRRIER